MPTETQTWEMSGGQGAHPPLGRHPDIERAVEQLVGGSAVAIAAIDLDNFGEFNREFGHEAGDKVLESFDRTLRGSLPEGAQVHRVGGDEWLVVLPDASSETALILFEEIRSHWTSHYPSPEPVRRIGVSVGVSSRPPHATDPADLITAAQDALMRSKREGRNRSAIYVEEKMRLKSNYYSRASLDRLAKLSDATGRTEASLLREALDDLFAKHRDEL